MSVQAHAWAKTVKTGSPTLKAVLVAVADYADATGRAFPSQEQLAADTEFSLRAVRNAILGLEELGLLEREERRRKDGSRSTDILTLAMGQAINRHDVPPDEDQPAARSEQPARRSKQPAPHDSQPARGAGLTSFEPSLNHQKNHSDADASGATGRPAKPVHWAIDDTASVRRQPYQPRPAYQPAPTGQAARLATLVRQRQERIHVLDHGTRDFLIIDGDLADEPDDVGRGGEAGRGSASPAQPDRRAPDPLQRAFQSRAEHAAAQAANRRRRAP